MLYGKIQAVKHCGKMGAIDMEEFNADVSTKYDDDKEKIEALMMRYLPLYFSDLRQGQYVLPVHTEQSLRNIFSLGAMKRYFLFAVDQTTLPFADEKTYRKLLEDHGTAEERGVGEGDERSLHIRFNDFLLKMRENLVPIRTDGSGIAHYDTEKDVVYMPRQKDFEHYNDYVQEALRQIVSATGHQQRLAREGMVMQNGIAPSEDAVKREQLTVELASGIKMLELGLPARLTVDSMKMTDYWVRELKENPCLIDAIESDVNNALTVMRKAERGEKIEYATMRNQREVEAMKDQLPKHYRIADEIKQQPDKDAKTVVLVMDKERKTALKSALPLMQV